MSDEVDFAGALCGPKVDGEDIIGCVDFALRYIKSACVALNQSPQSWSCHFGTERRSTDLMSNSAFVAASRTTSLMHGGGVMGRLSCRSPTMSQPSYSHRVVVHSLPCPQIRTFELLWVVGSHPGCSRFSAVAILPHIRLELTCIPSHLRPKSTTLALAATLASWAAASWSRTLMGAGMEEFCDRDLEENSW